MSEENQSSAESVDTQATQESSSEAIKQETTVTSEINLSEMVSDDYKALIDSKGFKDINDVVKSYANLETLVGNSVRIPSQDASPESKSEFYSKIKDLEGVIIKPSSDEGMNEYLNKIGRPESSDKYDLSEAISEDVLKVMPSFNQEVEDFKSMAHEIGLTNKQAQALVKMRSDATQEFTDNSAAKLKDSEAKLHEIWGQDYDNRLASAKSVSKIYAEKYPDQMSELINGPAGSNPAFLNMLSELGQTFKEKGHEGLQSATYGLTPQEAANKIAEKRADVGFMRDYNDPKSPKCALNREILNKLYAASGK